MVYVLRDVTLKIFHMDIKLNKLLIMLNGNSIRLVYMNDDFKYIVTVF